MARWPFRFPKRSTVSSTINLNIVVCLGETITSHALLPLQARRPFKPHRAARAYCPVFDIASERGTARSHRAHKRGIELEPDDARIGLSFQNLRPRGALPCAAGAFFGEELSLSLFHRQTAQAQQ
jgi:hypothetical protein